MPRFTGTPDTEKKGGRFGGVLEVKDAPEMVPSYDPMGVAIGYTEAAPQMPAQPMPYGEQMRQLGQTALGYGKGAVSQIAGIPGDVEYVSRLLYNLGAQKTGLPRVGEEPYFKTTEERGKQLFGEAKTPGEKVGRAFG